MARTVTITHVGHGHGHNRPRSLSLSLIGREVSTTSDSNLERLPSELIESIIELALLSSNPVVLSTVSKAINLLLNQVLYRTVILSSMRSIHALHHTATSSPHLLLLVKKLVVTADLCEHVNVGDIVAACKYLHALTLPNLVPIPTLIDHKHLEEVTFASFVTNHRNERLRTGSATVKRLRFVEPSECGWVPPCEMLEAFGNPEGLTHLQLARKAGSNEDNDRAFRDDVISILEQYRELKVVVLSIYSGHPWESDGTPVKESHMWKIMENMREVDGRIVILEGERYEWMKEAKGFQPGDSVDSTFWARF